METKAFPRSLVWAVTGVLLLGALAPLWAVEGRPPYAFFGLLKVIVVGVSALGAWALYQSNRALIPLCFFLAAAAFVHIFGKMHRAEWAPFDWATVGLFCLCGMVLPLTGGRGR